ncbi:MAG: hypothetical protein PHY98_00125 [Candidatus Cloacimonetes bacterium]|nr:hypothetical protein [Candidatus Cloacimonadota bacterium]
MPMLVWLVLLLFPMALGAESSGYVIDETILLNSRQHDYKLIHSGIINRSESVRTDSLSLLPNRDYTIDYKSGYLHLKHLPETGIISISYLIIPPEITKPVFTYESFVFSDSSKVVSPRENIFTGSSRLQITGSKTFALSFSESGETDLLQSLYVNLGGELSKDVQIEARLSDSQSKLSPEGDSKELSSLDRVFIRVYSPRWQIGMGDLDLSLEDSKYLGYQTKIEGISASYKGDHEALAAYSAGSGKRANQTIGIIDGKQGPYYLSANSYQRSFIVVAGSEEVYLDGERLERGTDYYIDYAEGSIMFRRMVASANIVHVYFQYSEENYSQSTYFAGTKVNLGEHFKVSAHLIHQLDAKNKPLLFEFDESDLDSLNAAGDNDVYSSGILETDPGSGSYVRLISPEGVTYYEYAWGDSSAIYNLIFSYVGSGMGDYTEFSVDRFRWVGMGNGTHIIAKRLSPPVKRSNMDLSLAWQSGGWQSGIDALYSNNDRNSLSDLDDHDNAGGIASAYLKYLEPESPFELGILAEHRLPDTYRFSSRGNPEHDFSTLVTADSLAQSTIDLSMNLRGQFWRPNLLLRWRDLDGLYTQKALRFTSESDAWSVLPSTRWQSTISEQSGEMAGTLHYHNAELRWRYLPLELSMSGLMNSMINEAPDNPDTRYYRMQPALAYQSEKQNTQISFSRDNSDFRITKWKKANSSDTYSIRHSGAWDKHSLDLECSHRVLQNPQSIDNPESSYDLLRLRASHNFLRGSLSLINNYELNQTEFFPKIRDLIYVGQGLGYYDSTGVMVDTGDYDYEYITSQDGVLSTEITALASIYLKPGLYLKAPIWQKVHSDISLNGTEQRDASPQAGTWLFLPEYSFDNDHTIYGRQSYLQNLWLDLYKGRIIANLSTEQGRDLDRRYQSAERSNTSINALKLDLKGYWGLNNRFEIISEQLKESRYDSLTRLWHVKSSTEKNFSASNTANLELAYISDTGEKQSDAAQNYRIHSLSLAPAWRSIFKQKYRVSGRFSLGYNFREGSSFLAFLPQKREGFVSDAQLLGIYRINSYSSFSLEYRFSKYPEDKSSHNLKLEFKAEL